MLHFKSFSPKWGISPNLHSLSVATLGNKTSPMNIRSDCPLQSQVHLIGLLRIYKNKVNRPIYFYLSWQLLGTHLPHDLHPPPIVYMEETLLLCATGTLYSSPMATIAGIWGGV